MRRGWSGIAPGRSAVLLALLLGAGPPPEARAQLPLKIWARPLLAVPIGDFAGRDNGVDARPTGGFDAGGSLSLGALRVYGEYTEVDFGCDECAEAGLADAALDRGWGAGVVVPISGERFGLVPWVRLGVIGHHLRFRSEVEAAYSNRSLGWAAGGGAEIRPARWLRVEPAVIFRHYDTTFGFRIDVPDRDLSVSYLGLGLALGIEL
ncbi:MAG TPA: hypothetical protein VFZ18_08965 [Longimicrobiaceae bacterium]